MPNTEPLLDKAAGNQNKFHMQEKDAFQSWIRELRKSCDNQIISPTVKTAKKDQSTERAVEPYPIHTLKTNTKVKCLTPNFCWTRPQAIKINSTCRRKIVFNLGYGNYEKAAIIKLSAQL